MAMKDTDMTATRFVMRLPGQGGQVRELVIEGSGMTYQPSGAMTAGLVTSITLMTSDKRSGDSLLVWTGTGLTVDELKAFFGEGFWNHVNTIGSGLPKLIVSTATDAGGDTVITVPDTPPDEGTGGDEGGGAGDVVEEPELPAPSVIMGTPDRDRLRGTDDDDRMFGLEDNDRMRGRDGDDAMFGGDGNDRMRGDRGDDTLYGDEGNDRLRGDKGHDLIIDTDGNNRLRGGAGDDTLVSGQGRDVMIANGGDDVIVSGGGSDFAMGLSGHDIFVFCADNAGTLRIKGFDATDDSFDLCGIATAAEELALFLAEARQDGRDVVWQHGAMTVILERTSLDAVNLGNFAGETGLDTLL
jgi:Ca2+-binding RTX toxin-like protein